MFFCARKSMDSFTLKHNSFQIEIIEKSHIVLLPDLKSFSSYNVKFENSKRSALVVVPQKLT